MDSPLYFQNQQQKKTLLSGCMLSLSSIDGSMAGEAGRCAMRLLPSVVIITVTFASGGGETATCLVPAIAHCCSLVNAPWLFLFVSLTRARVSQLHVLQSYRKKRLWLSRCGSAVVVVSDRVPCGVHSGLYCECASGLHAPCQRRLCPGPGMGVCRVWGGAVCPGVLPVARRR